MDIAIVGIGCRFPGGADSPGKFWQLLGDGIDAVTEVPAERFDVEALFDPDPGKPGKLFSRWGGFVDGIDSFDAGFFGISPREAQRIDPQHRLLLEAAWEALEDGGLPADRLAGTSTGVFVGIATTDYGRMQLDSSYHGDVDTYALLGTSGSVAANRISFHLDLRGPSMAVDTACSSSLVAVHLACRSLASGESDVVLTGGVNAFLTPEPVIGFCKAGMLSPDGQCRAFDASANGYVRAEGVGVLALKPLSAAVADGDPIHAVIRGSATNQDGHTAGITVPRSDAQRDLIRTVLAQAGLRPEDVQYVEAHGTGTPVGDPIEARAIGDALASARPDTAPLLIGSVKTNIGHLEAAAGVAGLIKATLALEHRQIPPHLHLKEINPEIPLDELRMRIPTGLEPWPSTTGPARAGVNSFGFGGANAHIVLEEPPPTEREPTEDGQAQLLTLSARDEGALTDLASRYRDRLRDDSLSLTDACYTAALRRTHHDHRLAVVATSRQECLDQLDEVLSGGHPAGTAYGTVSGTAHGVPPKLAFVFSGMGPLWWGMGRQLMHAEPVYRAAIEECDRLLRPLAPWSLLDELAEGEADSRVNEPDRAPVVNVAVHVALAALWRSWGIVPDAVVGHSAGELGAACVAGALTLPDALHNAYHRGRLQQRASGTGTMLAVGMSEADARELISDTEGELSLAAVNSPTAVTLSGSADALERIAAELERRDVFARFLPVSVPYHGPRMDPIRDELLTAMAELSPRPASVRIASVVTGDWVEGDRLDAGYWWRNVREPVRFADAVDTIAGDGDTYFIELGPHPVLASSLRDCLAAQECAGSVLPTLRRQQDERLTMLGSLAELYVQGREVDWTGVFADGGRCVRLPTYAWQRERHWIEPPTVSPARPHGEPTDHPLLGWRLHSAHRIWEAELSDARLSYLDGHALGETAVFPGTGYVEMALAAASAITGADTVAMSDMRFRALLALAPRDDVVVQTVHDAGQSAIEIHSTTAGERSTWTLHATARLGHSAGTGDPVELAAVRDRCAAALDVDEYYRSLASRGYRYGGMFRGISAIWRGQDEAIGLIEVPPGGSADGDGYLVHPGLLDSALQVLLAATPAKKSGDVLVPVSIDRIEFHHPPGARFWVHAWIRGDGAASVHLLDDAGGVAMTCDGLRLQPAGSRAEGGTAAGEDTYEVRWRPDARDDGGPRRVLAPSAIIETALPSVRSLAADQDWESHYADVEPQLNAIAVHFARAALTELGWDGDVEVVPEQRRYLAQLAQIVRDADPGVGGPLAAATDQASAKALADRLWAEHPDDRAVIEVLRGSGERLVDVLRGRVDAREAMFAGDAVETLAAFYGNSGPLRHANSVLAEVFAAISEQHASPLRILEVGAGTGGATAAVLPRLPVGSVEYTFTDVSPFFLASAKSRFADRADMRFGILDIEDGVPGGGDYDVVLAADVLHATADLRTCLRNVRRLLRPGGTLVLLEVTSRTAMGDVIFGALEGWWRFTDTDLRPSYPLLEVAQWQALLEETGFTQAHAVSDVFGGDHPMQAVLVAQSSTEPPAEVACKDWVIVGGEPGVADAVAAGLNARGEVCTLVAEVPVTVDDWTRLLADRPGGLLYLAALDAPDPGRLTTAALMEHQSGLCSGVAALVRAMQASSAYPELCLVTAGAHRVSDDDGPPRIAQSPLWGLGRVLLNEHPDLRCRLVDLGAACPASDIDGLVEELTREPDHTEMAFRDGKRHARSLDALGPDRAGPADSHLVSPDETAFRLVIGSPGTLASARLEEVADTVAGPGEMVIRVRATSLNFRDVLLALDIAPGEEDDTATATAARLGFDCAGVVLACGSEVRRFRPGDEIVTICEGGALGSRLIVDEYRAALKPAELSFAEAASVPGAFLTADYALNHVARIEPGERVLIHSASGGVGLAAVQIARRAGAEVFATAGSAEKRAYLHSIGIEHVFDSRSLAFAEEIMDRTGGEGVDVILNALAGEAIRAGLSILRPYGRFVEIGKRDIFENTPIGLLPFQRNLSFCAFDLIQLCLERPAVVGRMLADTVDRIARGELSVLPIREFDLADAEEAFRFMAQSRHIGKVVLTVDQPAYPVCAQQDTPLVHSDATYLITGGLGGIGLALASWMVRRGGGHIVLMSRSGVPADDDLDVLRDLQDGPATVVIERGDVGSEHDVARVLDRIRQDLPPLRGIVHAAMVLDDGLLADLDQERFERVLAPKVAGAWELHRSTVADELDFFVLFSSIASVAGTVMQGNYAAANAFLDGLASYRRALGLPALAVNWGPIGEVGYVSRHPEVGRFLAREGMLSISPDEAFAALEESLRQGRSNTVAVRTDRAIRPDASALVGRYVATFTGADASGPDSAADLVHRLSSAEPAERSALLVEHLVRRAARVLATSVDRVGLDRPLPELGFDSLMAVELQAALKQDLGVQLSVAKLLEGTSIREIAALALDQLALAAPAAPAAVPAEPTEPVATIAAEQDESAHHPLSAEQRWFWLLDQLRPGDPGSIVHTAVRLSGNLDVVALERALNAVVRRHEVLRARLLVVDGDPVQVFPAPTPVPLPVVDVPEDDLHRLAGAQLRQPFDLTEGPLLRGVLFRLDHAEHVLVVTAHHIAFDPWCARVLVGEITALYADFRAGRAPTLPPPTARYVDYVHRQRERLTEELLESQLDYWRGQLADVPATVALPADRPRPATPSHRGGHLPFQLDAAATEALTALSRSEGVTLFMTLLAGWLTVLHRCSRQDDISVGTPVTTRGALGGEDLVGCCINTLVLRGDLSGDPTFGELLSRVRDVALGAYDHQDVPFDRIVESLRPPRDGSMSPLFSTMLVLYGLPMPQAELAGLRVSPVEIDSEQALFDLLLVLETGERLGGTLEFSTDLFADTAERLLGYFQQLLTAAAEDPGQRLSELPLLPADQRDLVVRDRVAVPVDLGPPCCAHELIEEQAARTPDAVAVVFEGAELTYQELDRRANLLAHRLCAEQIGPGSVVGVAVRRSSELVVAVLAVLKAGAAFLPLDPDLPLTRLRLLIADARARVVLASRPLPVDAMTIVVAEPGDTEDIGDSGAPAPGVTPDGAAYVIYTSGSTGTPKAVAVPHRAIVNQLRWRQATFPLTGADAVLQRTPVGFDPAVWELLGPLMAGATVVMPRPGSDHDGAYLAALITEREVTTLQVVPSLLDALLAESAFADCHTLRRVFCGGEMLTPALVDRFFDTLSAELHNLYGPTETAIDATHWACLPGSELPVVPIGRPIGNVSVSVLDERRQPVPVGIPGELYIGGAGVALGYLNQPALTAERFLPEPFRPGSRMYRTGDIGRLRADGAIEFLGRADQQLKVRGMRVEPAEVEAVLTAHPTVTEAAVVAQGGRLVAFVVSTDAATLARFADDRLPAHLVPDEFVWLPALPRTASSKVDRSQLARTRIEAGTSKSLVAPRDTTELRLLRIWEEELKTGPIGVTDDFFALGGHSLLAMRLAARIHQELGWELPVAALVQERTVAGVARLLAGQPAPDGPLVRIQPRGTRPPFFCVHPVSGSVFDYIELAAALGDDQPCYALQARDSAPHTRIEDMASDYVNTVRSVQPTGPYLLCGWSMGGMVAFEMARQLSDTGEQVGLLAMLDVRPVGADAEPTEHDDVMLAGFARELGLPPDALTSAVHDLWRLDEHEQLAYVRQQVRRADLEPPGVDLDELDEHRWEVFLANARAMRAYQPRRYPGRLTVITASEPPGAGDDAAARWAAFTPDRPELHTAPGDHYTMLRAPHVHALAATVRDLLDKAFSR